MDINKLIDFYDREQKIIFSAFCITLPLAYTNLFLYIDSFKIIDLFVQIAFAISASICIVTITFFGLLISVVIADIDRNIRLFHLVIPQIIATAISVCTPNIFNMGIWEPIVLFIMMVIGIINSYYIIFRMLHFPKIKKEDESELKKKCRNRYE